MKRKEFWVSLPAMGCAVSRMVALTVLSAKLDEND